MGVRMPSTTTRLAAAGIAALTGAAAFAAAPAQAAGAEIHVSTKGSDSAAGTAAAPLRTVQAAIDRATPGTTIKVHAGTYSQVLNIKNSGTASARIVVTNAGDGAVTLTSAQAPDSCSNRRPSSRRTIKIMTGADYWTFQGLNIVHGAYLSGKGSGKAYSWHAGLVKKGLWEPRRQVPGTGSRNPTAARGAAAYLAKVTGTAMDPVEGISFIGNTMTGRGIYASLSNSGVVKDNVIKDIICGTGPGVWAMNHSNFWQVSGNDISRIKPAVGAHFMHEGIRFGSAANYNTITNNYVHDLEGDGRAFNTDVDGSWNTFSNNRAANVAIGYNDQMSGWGNTWTNNTVTRYRTYAFAFRMKDGSLRLPSKHSSTNGAIVSGNVASSPAGGRGLGVGGSMNSKFTGNTFPNVFLGKYLTSYWGKYGNTWNGSTRPPV